MFKIILCLEVSSVCMPAAVTAEYLCADWRTSQIPLTVLKSVLKRTNLQHWQPYFKTEEKDTSDEMKSCSCLVPHYYCFLYWFNTASVQILWIRYMKDKSCSRGSIFTKIWNIDKTVTFCQITWNFFFKIHFLIFFLVLHSFC